tara:strand:+ start:6380 stop:6757 length:378 start_codon:yes stop_codon:yes gene_type:complete
MGYKAQSITSKASSACKMNMDLVNGNTKANKTTDNGVDALSAGFQQAIAPPKEEKSPAEMRSSPAKLPIAAIAKVAPMVLGAMGGGKKKEGGGGGGTTKVIVNNSANSSSNSTSNSQAAGGIDPK